MIWAIYMLILPLAATVIATAILNVQEEDEKGMQIAGIILASGLAVLWPVWVAMCFVGLPAWLTIHRLRRRR